MFGGCDLAKWDRINGKQAIRRRNEVKHTVLAAFDWGRWKRRSDEKREVGSVESG